MTKRDKAETLRIKKLDSVTAESVTASQPASELTVEHWRKQYRTLFARFDSVTQLGTEAAENDDEFAGVSGWLRVRNVHADRGGLQITARLVRLMEQLRPEEPQPAPTRLTRQKLARPTA